MRIGIGEFVGARFPIPQNPILGVNGLGEFVPARFPIPQNPVGGMGDFAPACFPVPQNPIGLSGLGGDCGCGCNGAGTCKTGMEGLGDIMNSVTDTISSAYDSAKATVDEALGGNTATYLMVGGAIVVGYFLLSRGGGYRSASQSLSAEYKRKRAALKASYGRGYQRVGRAGKAAYAAL
jgi:hypothetical protein